MLFLTLVATYLVGCVFAARHEVYQIKVRNEKKYWRGIKLEPRVYVSKDYEELFHEHVYYTATLRGNFKAAKEPESYPSDVPGIVTFAMLWPLLGGLRLVGSLGKL